MKRKSTKPVVKTAKQPKKEVTPQVEDVEDSPEEEVVQPKKTKKSPSKKPSTSKKVVLEEPSADEDDSEIVQEEQEDSNAEESSANVGDGDEEENGAEEQNGDNKNGGQMETEDDEAPTEENIGKEEPTIPSKIKVGPIHPSVPANKIIHVTKLPNKCKKINVVEAFGKYGAIDQIHILTSPTGTTADIAFKTEKGAAAAFADKKNINVNDTNVSVSIKKKGKNESKNPEYRDCTVFVKNFKEDTTEQELREHFEACGEIESVSVKNGFKSAFGFVTFKDKSAVPAALKLHNSLLNDVNILVYENRNKSDKRAEFDENLTVKVKNTQNLQSINVTKLEAIFSKCGEIDNMIVLCKGNVLALITFKTEEAVQNAINLSGKTEHGIALEVESSTKEKKCTSIHVNNLPRDCTEEDLRNIFSKAGDIVSLQIKKGFAIIQFTNSEEYCKSFLYNESFIRGHAIFVEPHSFRKQRLFKARTPFHKRGKSSGANGYNALKPKKVETI